MTEQKATVFIIHLSNTRDSSGYMMDGNLLSSACRPSGAFSDRPHSFTVSADPARVTCQTCLKLLRKEENS